MSECVFELLEDVPAGRCFAVSARGTAVRLGVDGKWYTYPGGRLMPLDAFGPWAVGDERPATEQTRPDRYEQGRPRL